MSIDPYQPCFCGSGKKVKFCCSKDITQELDGILESVNGDQRIAALDKVSRLVDRVGRRDCLSVVKVTIQLRLGEIESARRELNEFLVSNPMNPIARALDAILEAHEGNVDQAVQRLQDALDVAGTTLSNHVVEAFGAIGTILLQAGRFRAARHHLTVFDQLQQSEAPQVRQMIMQTYAAQYVPLLLKGDSKLLACPEGAEWAEDFEAAMQVTQQGRWRAAIRMLEDIDDRFPDQASVLKNIAILNDYLGDPEDCCDAWRNYSRLEGLGFIEAVEAEATAQLLDPEPPKCVYKLVRRTFAINDVDGLLARLGGEKRFSEFEISNEEQMEGPPPKAGYYFLNKSLPESGEDLNSEQVPEIIGQFFVFGRQTDRDPRLEWFVTVDEHADAVESELKQLLGDQVGDMEAEYELNTIPKASHRLEWRCRWPADTPIQTRKAATVQKRRELLLNEWPSCPLDVLDRKTPSEVAGDPEYTVPLQAALLLLEDFTDVRFDDEFTVNDLRDKLGLERYDLLRPSKEELVSLSISQLTHLDYAALDDEELIDALKVASSMSVPRAILGASREIVKREQLDSVLGTQFVYHGLARFEPDDETALECALKARNIAVNKGESAGLWLVHELEIRLERGITDRCDEIVRQLEARFMSDSNVANELVRVLTRFGVISREQGAAPMQESDMPMAASAEPAAGVWTPESGEQPSAGQEEAKSKLWLPGME